MMPGKNWTKIIKLEIFFWKMCWTAISCESSYQEENAGQLPHQRLVTTDMGNYRREKTWMEHASNAEM